MKSQYIRLQGLNPDEVWTQDMVDGLYQNTQVHKRVQRSLGVQRRLLTFFADCKSLLDVGCGFNPRLYDLPNLEMIGADISPHMIKLGRELHPEFTFIEANVYDLPFGEHQFDAVQSFGMLRHMITWEPALQEMLRVAKKKLVFTHLVGDKPRKCGPYQWCTTRTIIQDLLPAIMDTFVVKSWQTFKSILFLAEI